MVKKGDFSIQLEKKIFTAIAILSFIGALVCLSPNITGNIIGELSPDSTNLLSAIFLIIGLASVGIIKIRD
jgi:uncharacterized membrane protein YuzA (DUF378 family)